MSSKENLQFDASNHRENTKGQFEGRTRTWSNFGFWYRGLKQEA
jgi:hypothetical protein